MEIILSWPAKELSPNARIHWRKKAPLKKAQRLEAWAVTHQAMAKTMKRPKGLNVSLIFFPPDRRKRDLDNCIASCKSMLDGIADALGVNDNQFQLTCKFAGLIGGYVAVDID